MAERKLFGTDGIRGKANAYPVNPEVALKLGKAVAKHFNAANESGKRVVIGKDTRLSGYMLESALTSGLVSMGMDVMLVGPVPTPAVAHLTKSLACTAGIMLTASHNPYTDNGIKIFDSTGFKLDDETEAAIEKLILDDTDIQANGIDPGSLGKAKRIEDARGRYIEFAKSSIHSENLRGLKIVLDCANGASYLLGPWIFSELGAEVIKTGTDPDGVNINLGCGAMCPEGTAKLVKETGADIGICFDGDADRVIICDADGNVIDGDRVLAMLAIDFKQQGKLAGDTLVVTSMTNLGLHDAMKANGINVSVTDVGDRYVIERMREEGYNLGGEKSGHVILLDYASTGDGIITALSILNLMQRSGKTVAELADCMEEYPQRQEGVMVREKLPLEKLPGISAVIKECETDLGDEGRVIVRYSGTEKKMRTLVESRSQAKVDSWSEKLLATINQEVGA